LIALDTNILLYAVDSSSLKHASGRKFLEENLSSGDPVGLPWPVLTGFLRISTNPRIQASPLTALEAQAQVQEWLDLPCVRTLAPTVSHWEIFSKYIRVSGASAGLIMDAHIAAISEETDYKC